MSRLAGEQNPFVRYRERLDVYSVVTDGSMSDDEFVDLTLRLDSAVAEEVGHGFVVTPVHDGTALASAAGLDLDLWVKAEPRNVGGSHKARHLFGVALHLLVSERLGAPRAEWLAIASCGNAAIGAAIVARALGRNLEVFVPTWAQSAVTDLLDSFGATVHRCPRIQGEPGDPCYHRFQEAVAGGAHPFSVQGTDTPTTFDGGRTLGWELAEQVDSIDSLYVQVGGGALATAVSMAVPDARLHPVQAAGCAPLRRAWDRLAPEFDFASAAASPHDYMWPWEDEPLSIATGILDDVTYDWLPLLERTHATGGLPIVAPEPFMVQAWELARSSTEIPVCTTGSAGFAGLLAEPPTNRERVALVFTGIDR